MEIDADHLIALDPLLLVEAGPVLYWGILERHFEDGRARRFRFVFRSLLCVLFRCWLAACVLRVWGFFGGRAVDARRLVCDGRGGSG